MIKSYAREMPDRIKGYVRENWGAPFIGGFMVLLISTAALMVTSSGSLANELAIYAYFALVVGVVLQLVCFLKYNKKSGEKNNGSS
jgi:heme/copper-type cytochrome/quinol oxidase subunit 4